MDPTISSGSSADITPSFTVGQALADAWRSFRRKLLLHMGWNASFLAMLTLASCLVTCVTMPLFLVAMGTGRADADPSRAIESMILPMVIIYVVLGLVMLVFFALHHGFTLSVTRSDFVGDATSFSVALREATPRVAPHIGATLIRYAVNVLVGAPFVGLYVYLLTSRGGLAGDAPALPAWQAVLLGVGYIAMLAWSLAVRSFLGLASAAVQHERLGPIEASRRSARLLEGRRLRYAALTGAWYLLSFVIFLVAYSPMFYVFVGRKPDESAILFMIPYMFAFYYFAMHMLSFDTVLEEAVYTRLVPRTESYESVANVFA